MEEQYIQRCGNCRGLEAVLMLGAERREKVWVTYHDEDSSSTV